MNILMVCHGNICRSPLAEGIMQDEIKKKGLDWQVDSAGTSSYHVGDAPHRLSQQVAREKGLNISHQKGRRFRKKDFEHFDKIYALDEWVYRDLLDIGYGIPDAEEKVDLLMNEVFPGEDQSVPDPWYGGIDGYYHAWDMIQAACKKIIEHYEDK